MIRDFLSDLLSFRGLMLATLYLSTGYLGFFGVGQPLYDAWKLHSAMRTIQEQSEKPSRLSVSDARERLSRHLGSWSKTPRGLRAMNLTERVLPSHDGPRLIVQYDYRYPLLTGVFMTSTFRLESSMSFMDTLKASQPDNH